MNFSDAEFVQGFIRMANDGWEQGWHERNGGNLTYRVKPEEVEEVKENLSYDKPWTAVFTRELWEMATECPVVFPDGIGVVPWMVPGGRDIAVATSELMKKYDVAIWAHHEETDYYSTEFP